MRKVRNTFKKVVAAFAAFAVIGSSLIITDKKLENVEAKSNGNWVVTLDPGHGGEDSGALGGNLQEKNCNLKIALYCKAYIESNCSNITVQMTRTTDTSVYLYNRAKIAKSYSSDLFVSMHNNSSPNSGAKGAEIYIPRYFYHDEMKVFGNDVINNIASATGIEPNGNGVKTRDCTNGELYTVDEVGAPSGSINPEEDPGRYAAFTGDKSKMLADYYGIINSGVLKQMPSCIIEHAFISNAADRTLLANEVYLKALGEADARAIIKYFESGVKQNEKYEEARIALNPTVENAEIGISYRAHVQNIGWMDWVKNGEAAGTTGRSLRVEAIRLYPYNMPEGGKIVANTHIQNDGWVQSEIGPEGGMIGTSGQSKRVEALSLKLEGVPGYEIEYRVHIQNLGWSRWMSQGEVAGTSGLSYRLESVEIKIVPSTEIRKEPYITYRSHVQNKGWLDWVNEGSLSGTSGKSLRMEALQIEIHNPDPGMYISAKVHVQNVGWITYDHVTPETIIGTSGRALRVEAINLMLNGTDKYKLQYRVHIQNLGWTGWIDQGNIAGTFGRSFRLEAMQIRLVEK